MFKKFTFMLVLVGLLSLAVAPAVAAAPPNKAAALQGVPVTGTIPGTDGGTFDGTIDITSITRDGDILNVTGAIDGLVSGVPGVGEISDTFTSTIDISALDLGDGGAACDILNLVLGPLTLDLLGLVVEIPEPIILNVRAEPGPGNLLGNLLCAVAGLLDGPSPLGQLIDNLLGVLNRLLG
jgi:hypothetical protein